MATEFGCGDSLLSDNVDEKDVENLLVQQIEFCSIIILNKVKAMIKTLQPNAKIIETSFGKVTVSEILNTECFGFDETATSTNWAQIHNKDTNDAAHNSSRQVDVINTSAPDRFRAVSLYYIIVNIRVLF